MKKRILSALLGAVLLLSGCAPKGQLNQYRASFLGLFDTVTVMVGYAESKDAFETIAQSVHDELQEYHQLFDIYNEYEGLNNLKTVNDSAGGAAIKVDRRIIDLLLFCRELYDETGGRVDVAMGSVLSFWHDAREAGIDDPENAALPDDEALRAAAGHMDFNSVIIDEESDTVQILDPGLRLDVGAVAKGYAVEQVCAAAPSGLLVSVGGNVRPTGPKQDGTPWTVNIQDPDGETDEPIRTVLVSDVSVVNSGDYQRYYTVDGVAYHHIIDPETLYPENRWRMVAILCADSGVADGLSTALFCMDREAGQKLLDQYGAEAMWVTLDGDVVYSPGFEGYLK